MNNPSDDLNTPQSMRERMMRPILRDLSNSSKNIQASAVISRDGFVLSAYLQEEIDGHRLGAISSTLLALADTATREMKKGRLKQVLVEAEQGYILVVQVGQAAVLAILTHPGVNLGMVLVEARRTAELLSKAL